MKLFHFRSYLMVFCYEYQSTHSFAHLLICSVIIQVQIYMRNFKNHISHHYVVLVLNLHCCSACYQSLCHYPVIINFFVQVHLFFYVSWLLSLDLPQEGLRGVMFRVPTYLKRHLLNLVRVQGFTYFPFRRCGTVFRCLLPGRSLHRPTRLESCFCQGGQKSFHFLKVQ